MTASMSLGRFSQLRILFALSIAVLVLGMMASSAAAASGPGTAAGGRIRESGTYTYASSFSTSCTEQKGRTVCTDTYLDVYSNSEYGTEACLSVETYALTRRGYDSISSEYGCSPVEAGAFTVNSKLSSATLSPTVITLNTYSCNRMSCTVSSSRDVTVSATFTGTGELSSYSGRGSFKEGDCTYKYSYKGSSRQAAVALTLDGVTSDASGSIGTETYTFSTNCDGGYE